MRSRNESFYRRRGKRIFDLATGIAIGIITLPVQAAVAAAVARKLGRPVFFRQQRPGLGGKPFELVKFRTMTDARDSTGELLSDAERLPPFGQFLRATSLDELPEILNVVRGDMSLVGPRPLLMRYLDRYSDTEFRRHEVRPGITGLAQVSGRNAVSWPQKFALDVEYVDDVSFWMDLKILARTIKDVLMRDGINEPGEATANEFLGNPGMAVDSN